MVCTYVHTIPTRKDMWRWKVSGSSPCSVDIPWRFHIFVWAGSYVLLHILYPLCVRRLASVALRDGVIKVMKEYIWMDGLSCFLNLDGGLYTYMYIPILPAYLTYYLTQFSSQSRQDRTDQSRVQHGVFIFPVRLHWIIQWQKKTAHQSIHPLAICLILSVRLSVHSED